MPGRRLRARHRHSKAAGKGELPRRYGLRITWLLLGRAEGHAVLCRRDIARAHYAAYLYGMLCFRAARSAAAATRATSNVQDMAALFDTGEVDEQWCQSAAPASHLELITIAIASHEPR